MLKIVIGKNIIRYLELEFFVFLIFMVNVDGIYYFLKKEVLGILVLLLNRMFDIRNSRVIYDIKICL